MYYGVMCLVCLPECCLVIVFRNVLLLWTLEDTPQTAGFLSYCILTFMVYSHHRFLGQRRARAPHHG